MYSPRLEPSQIWTPESLAERLCLASRRVAQEMNLSVLPQQLLGKALDVLVDRNALTDNVLSLCLSQDTVELRLTGAYHLRKFTLSAIPQLCVNLLHLDLGRCRQIDNRLIQNVIEACYYLEYLCLDGCVKISDSAFSSISFSPLKTLSLAGCSQLTPDGLVRILLVCERLETLNLAGCRQSVTDRVLWSIFDAASTDRLRCVDISGCSVLNSDTAFLQYPSGHVPLKSIKLGGSQSYCPKYTDAAVIALTTICGGGSLEEVETTWNSLITDKSLHALKTCKNLRRVNFTNSRVTSAGLTDLLSVCSGVRELYLSWVTGIDSTLFSSLNDLTFLDLSHCTDYLRDDQFLPQPFIDYIRARGNALTSLNLTELPSLCSSDCLIAMTKSCRRLQSLSLCVAEGAEEALSGLLASIDSVQVLSLDVTRAERPIDTFLFTDQCIPNLKDVTVIASSHNPVTDVTLSRLFSRKSLVRVNLVGAQGVTERVFDSWVSHHDPDKEEVAQIDFLLDAELKRAESPQRRFLSDSDATVVRHKFIKERFRSPKIQPLTQMTLTECAEGLRRLESFSVSGAVSLTDRSLSLLTKIACNLQRLELRDCGLWVTESSVEMIRLNCRFLRYLHLSNPKLRVRIDTSRSSRTRRRHSEADDSSGSD